jgi:hypothetical protein
MAGPLGIINQGGTIVARIYNPRPKKTLIIVIK